jgi:hypothetical protein
VQIFSLLVSFCIYRLQGLAQVVVVLSVRSFSCFLLLYSLVILSGSSFAAVILAGFTLLFLFLCTFVCTSSSLSPPCLLYSLLFQCVFSSRSVVLYFCARDKSVVSFFPFSFLCCCSSFPFFLPTPFHKVCSVLFRFQVQVFCPSPSSFCRVVVATVCPLLVSETLFVQLGSSFSYCVKLFLLPILSFLTSYFRFCSHLWFLRGCCCNRFSFWLTAPFSLLILFPPLQVSRWGFLFVVVISSTGTRTVCVLIGFNLFIFR